MLLSVISSRMYSYYTEWWMMSIFTISCVSWNPRCVQKHFRIWNVFSVMPRSLLWYSKQFQTRPGWLILKRVLLVSKFRSRNPGLGMKSLWNEAREIRVHQPSFDWMTGELQFLAAHPGLLLIHKDFRRTQPEWYCHHNFSPFVMATWPKDSEWDIINNLCTVRQFCIWSANLCDFFFLIFILLHISYHCTKRCVHVVLCLYRATCLVLTLFGV